MRPVLRDLNVAAACPDCGGSITSFECRSADKDYGHIMREVRHHHQSILCRGTMYVLLRCASCGRGGLAEIHLSADNRDDILGDFFPFSVERRALPGNVPVGVMREIREAETCAGVGANRAALAMLRSALEKTLKYNGYADAIDRSLAGKIDRACEDGIVPASMQRRIHDDVRGVGNFVLHDDWEEVSANVVVGARRYIQRVVEHFYDDREKVLEILREKGREPKEETAPEGGETAAAASSD